MPRIKTQGTSMKPPAQVSDDELVLYGSDKGGQTVTKGANLGSLPPVTTGSEEDPGTPAGRLDPGSSPVSRGNPGWDG